MPTSSTRARKTIGIFRRFRGNRNGSAAVEFAIVAPLFFTLLFAILETALVFFAGQALETGVHDAARLILTGEAKLSNMTQSQFRQKVCDRASTLFTCSGIYVEVVKKASFSDFDDTDPVNACAPFGTPQYTTGSASDVMVVRGYYQWQLVVTGISLYIGGYTGTPPAKCGKRLLKSTAVFRNEP